MEVGVTKLLKLPSFWSIRTIERVRQRFVEEGMEAALKCRPGAGRKQKLNGELEAHLIALRSS